MMYDYVESWFGEAVGARQMQRMAAFTIVWTVIDAIAERFAPKSIEDNDERRRFSGRVTGFVHAVSVICIAFWILLDPEETRETELDRLYGFSDRANLLFAHSCGFFLWDIFVCLGASKIDVGFLCHAIACFVCYLFGQYPYLHYWGVRFLLYELSTPFLNAMLIMRQLGYQGTLHDVLKNLFGYTFLVVRIFYGFYISAYFTKDSVELLQSGRAHSTFAVSYYLLANVVLNGLNSFWLYKMLLTRSKKDYLIT